MDDNLILLKNYSINNEHLLLKKLLKIVEFNEFSLARAIHLGCRHKHYFIVYTLIKYSKNIKLNNKSLLLAINNNDLEIVKLLLKYGCNPSYKNNRAIIISIKRNYKPLIKLLSQYNINKNTALLCALYHNNNYAFKKIINHEIKITNHSIYLSIKSNNISTLKTLLKCKNRSERILSYITLFTSNINILKLLVKQNEFNELRNNQMEILIKELLKHNKHEAIRIIMRNYIF